MRTLTLGFLLPLPLFVLLPPSSGPLPLEDPSFFFLLAVGGPSCVESAAMVTLVLFLVTRDIAVVLGDSDEGEQV